MFGNPNISANPIEDMYEQGQRYAGPQGSVDFGRPSLSQSFDALNPFSRDPVWGNPYMHQQAAIDSLSSRPMDAGMWGAQRIAAPVLAFSAGAKLFGGFRGAYNLGSTFSKGLGTGISSGLGFNGITSRAISSALGVTGGIAAGFALPYAAAQAGLWGAEKTLFNPYINTRRSAADFRQNFGGITLSDTMGQAVTGQGLGGRESASMASEITQAGIGSMTFSPGEYAAGASMISRSGLLDSAGTKAGITTRIKESMEQVKLIMSIASMPEMRDAIEQLAKLQKAGASVTGGLTSNAATTMMKLGGLASIAGVSVQKLMNTVGLQGQYTYQANGMTPYLGQLAAGNTYASFAAGNRMGLFSAPQLARMGGLEGATQASLSGQITASQSMFNMMGNYNQYIGGQGRGTGMVGTITQFGQDVARDPIGVMGGARMYARTMAGKQLNETGTKATQDQISEIAKSMHLGKLTAEKAFMILTSPMIGQTDEQAIAFLQQVRSESDPKTHELTLKALDADLVKQQAQFVSQNGIYSGLFGSAIYNTRKFGNSLTQNMSNAVAEPLSGAVGGMSDYFSKKVNELFYKDSITPKGDVNADIARIFGDKTSAGKSDFRKKANDSIFKDDVTDKLFSIFGGDKFSKVTQGINSMYLNDDESAKNYIQATDPSKRREILKSMIRDKKFDAYTTKKISGVEGFNELNTYLEGADRSAAQDTVEYMGKQTGGVLESMKGLWDRSSNMPSKNKGSGEDNLSEVDKIRTMTGLTKSGLESSLRAMSLAGNIFGKTVTGGSLSGVSSNNDLLKDSDLKEFMALTGETDPNKALERANLLARTASSKHLNMLADVGGVAGGYKFHDKDLEAKYKAALKNGKNSQLSEKIKLQDMVIQNGGEYRGGDSGAMNHTADEVAGLNEIGKQFQSGRDRINNLAREHKIDFTTSERILQSLDEKENTATFGLYVKEFGKHVAELDNKKNDNEQGGTLINGARELLDKLKNRKDLNKL